MARAQLRHRPPAAHRPREQPAGIDKHRTGRGAHFECQRPSKFRGPEPQVYGRDDTVATARHDIPSSCDAKRSKNMVSKGTASMPNRAMPSSQSTPACRVKSVLPRQYALLALAPGSGNQRRASYHASVLIGRSALLPPFDHDSVIPRTSPGRCEEKLHPCIDVSLVPWALQFVINTLDEAVTTALSESTAQRLQD